MNPAEFLTLLHARHCQRAFTDEPVSRGVLEAALSAAGQAPSGKNTQPWRATVTTGARRDALSNALCAEYDAGAKPQADYDYSLQPQPKEWMDRARACGYALFELKDIARDDVIARKAHGRENFTFFGAPVHMILHLPAGAERGNFLDAGMFLQNLMLALTALGLGSCPQYSVAGYSDVIRATLRLPADRWIVCGLSIGHPDPTAGVNSFVPDRLPLVDFVDWQQ